MVDESKLRVVVTGGPGAGKTALLEALQSRGYAIVADSPRAIIQHRKQRGLSPRPEPHEFARETLRMDVDNYERLDGTSGYIFFERSVLDALCSLDHVAPLGDELNAWLSKYRYCRKVFVPPPWQDIYVTDAERDHTFAHAERVHRIVCDWYGRCGYQVVELPKTSVEERCDFVLRTLAID